MSIVPRGLGTEKQKGLRSTRRWDRTVATAAGSYAMSTLGTQHMPRRTGRMRLQLNFGLRMVCAAIRNHCANRTVRVFTRLIELATSPRGTGPGQARP
jgi:hypothetical protein